MSIRVLSGRSIRAHILLIVLVGAILPLTIIGVLLTRSALRSGTDLLRQQLTTSVNGIATSVAGRWQYRHGELLLLADNLAARAVVGATPQHPASAQDSAYLARLALQVSRTIPGFAYRNSRGEEVWSSAASPSGPPGLPTGPAAPQPLLVATLPTHDGRGRIIGQLEARIAIDALVASDSGRIAVPGAVLGIRNEATGALLTPGFPRALVAQSGEARIHGGDWILVRRAVSGPGVELVAAAPTLAYVAPFQAAARIGFGAVLLVAVAALGLSAYLTRRVTRPLESLVTASSAVAQGDMERRVAASPNHPREIEALARAFNVMTQTLNRTLAELSRRSALAAVGEFAASFAHEVRNSLTSVRVDLQRAEEKLPAGAATQDLVSRSLVTVTNLDATVTGALRVARSGTVSRRQLDLRPVIIAAAERACASFAIHDALLDVVGSVSTPLEVSGDAAALEQLFLNILMNAAQALPKGGRATVTTEVRDRHVLVAVTDNGGGISAADVSRVFDPFFTTRLGGTGLGLPIARQIAIAHGGDLTLESRPGFGTTVTVRLPALA